MNPSTLPPELASQPVVVTLPVQWGDQDAFGHVNNVLHFRWFETARVAYFDRASLVMSNADIGPILASIKCDYRRQLTYPDTVLVSASITRIGRSSMQMRHLLYSQSQQALAAEGESVIVTFDYASQKSVPVPDAVRAKIEQLEGRPLSVP